MVEGWQLENDVTVLQAVTHQPVAVGICASQSMMFYSGGVISTCCEGLNHGVLVAGYGSTSNGDDYYLVSAAGSQGGASNDWERAQS